MKLIIDKMVDDATPIYELDTKRTVVLLGSDGGIEETSGLQVAMPGEQGLFAQVMMPMAKITPERLRALADVMEYAKDRDIGCIGIKKEQIGFYCP